MVIRNQRALIGFIVGSLLTSFAQAGAWPQDQGRAHPERPQTLIELQRQIGEILGQPQFATTRWGVLIESLDRDLVLFARDAEQLFTPASNMKLYTTAAALVRLRPEFRFRTSVYALAKPDERGHVEGDLILYGRGDPNLSTRTGAGDSLSSLYLLADQLYQSGVRLVLGDIVGDESFFTGSRLGAAWEWDDLQWYYGAEISALSVDDNAVELTLQPGEFPGDPVEVFIRPESSYMTILNRAVTTAARTQQRIMIERALSENVLEIRGTMPLESNGYRASISIHNPALYAATLFKDALIRRGMKVIGKTSYADWKYRLDHPIDLKALTELAFVESMPLAEEIRILNKISQNLHAEILLRTLGAVVSGEGSDEKGLEVLTQFLREIGARMKGVRFRDGSGLSRQDLITPATTVDLLRYMYKHTYGEIYRASLPVGGVDGTLERRMVSTRAEGNVQAKTGTLAYTITLAGYLSTVAGEHLAFSIMANNHTGSSADVTRAADEICALLAEFEG